MSGKIIIATAAALFLGSTAFASAQTPASPHYWGGGGYDGPGTPAYAPGEPGVGPEHDARGPAARGYYAYAPGFHRGNDNGGRHTGGGRR